MPFAAGANHESHRDTSKTHLDTDRTQKVQPNYPAESNIEQKSRPKMASSEVRAPSKMAKMSKQEASSQEDVDYIAENMDVMFEVVNNLLQVEH